ncbi:hypothetical protein [Carboxylicivirga linearis]|uniref:Ubiquitin-like domain-containing protein n=1 Tax=Carboxylicivirga linearis TaxID=1628157 RepID=A0ABS5K229_9BACT|nr:hypothetical protein [Carboxylicivirga linearis]MBS2101196.1 hypothetical protein [Carboxylicivirga linearis]
MNDKTVFFIEKKKFETSETQLTVKQILVDNGGYNPQENVLVLKQGHDLDELNDLEQVIEMKNGMHFSIFSKKPNPVS